MTRNENGAGSIYKDKTSGRWVGTITTGIEIIGERDDGSPKYRQTRRKVTARTQKDARAKLDALRRELVEEDGVGIAASASVAEFLEHWISDVLPLADIASTTRDQYTRIARIYLIPTIGSKRLDALSPADVRDMLKRLGERPILKKNGTPCLDVDGQPRYISPATLRQCRSVLARALRSAEVDDLVARNVARLVDGVKQTGKEGRTLTPTEARTLIAACHGRGVFEALVLVLLSLGLRKGEALGLSWADIDFDAPRLTVRRALKKDGRGGLFLDEPKTARSKRTVRLPASLVAVLRAQRDRQEAERAEFGDGWGGHWSRSELVFTNAVGAPLDPDKVNREIQSIAVDAGLGRWTPHELRHSAASLLIAQGVPLKTVSEMLGHSSIRVTADVYGHLLDDARAEAASAIEGVLWPS